MRPSVAFPSQRWRDRLSGWRQRARSSSASPEDSRLLRGMVQLLVSVGIVSISVAAAGVTQASLLNLLAIPVSALGGYWSWKSRHRPNIAIKFAIAFGMLMALGIFLARLVGDSGDTRIRLAELLIHLQVLHSFDMPRRKDLGYSVVIGLILLGVAATVSQTLTFAPLLILFVAIALPVLILDYQSRLGVVMSARLRSPGPLGVRSLTGLLLLVIGLGLAIFAVLPRLPGYQLQNFPVSETLDFQGEFSGDRILNPGYSTGGSYNADAEFEQEAGGGGSGADEGSPLQGPGQMDSSVYYGFSQQMNQNLRGTLTPQVVMRVRSQAPGFWRVVAFDRYTGQGWEISQNDAVEILERPAFSYQIFLPSITRHTPRRNQAARDQEIIQTYTVVNPLPNLIPALYQPEELYFPTRQVAIDAEGSLRSPVPLLEGVTFTVVSEVPYRDRTQLREAGTDYPDIMETVYLQVPSEIRQRVRQQTEALLAESPQPLSDAYEKALFLAQALKQTYTVQSDLPFFAPDEDLVEAFLFRYEGGYPDHFSTVLTMMLRSIGIPARLVAGFGPGQFNPFTGYYVVSNTDAYAIPEVYFPDHGWFAFDPIPGHEVLPPSIRDSQTFGVLRQFWNWVAGWLPSPVAGWLDGVMTGLGRLVTWLVAIVSQGVWGLLVALLGATGLVFLIWLAWRGWQHWRRRARWQRLPPMERLYQHLLSWLATQGYPKRPTQTPLEYAIALQQQAQGIDVEGITDLIQAYTRWRYGNGPESSAALQQRFRTLRRHRRR